MADSSEIPPPSGERLQKILSAAGVDSRRKCEEYVRTGRVTVDGEIITDLAARVDPEEFVVRVDGQRIKPQRKRYYLLNKPSGVVCTNRDPRRRPRAIDLVPANERLFTVGRLDESSEGLLIVTNDGEFSQRAAHPRYQVPRVYRLQVAGVPSRETLAELRKGLHFSDGRFGLKRARRLKTQGKSSFVEVELTQGQNREIRRLFARVGHKVIWLRRIAFGDVRLGDLALGKYRPLSAGEVKSLMAPAPAKKPRATRPSRKTSEKSSPKSSRKSTQKRSSPSRRVIDLTSEKSSAKPARQNKKRRPAGKR